MREVKKITLKGKKKLINWKTTLGELNLKR